MTPIKGNDFVLQIKESGGSYKTILCGSGYTLTVNTDMEEATVGCAGKFKQFFPGYNEWSLSIEGVASFDDNSMFDESDLLNYQLEGTELLFLGDIDGDSTVIFEGNIILKSHEIRVILDDAIKFTAQAQGSGELTVTKATNTIYYGTQSVSTTPVSWTTSLQAVLNANITVDYGTITGAKYFYVAMPSTFTDKTTWTDLANTFNSGSIGASTDLFEIRSVTISATAYDLYITRYATNFNGSKVKYS